jgi:hypothetical protein
LGCGTITIPYLYLGSLTARQGRITIFKEDIALCYWALLVS